MVLIHIVTVTGQDDVHMGQDDFPIGHLAPIWWGKMTNFDILLTWNLKTVAPIMNSGQIPFARASRRAQTDQMSS